MSDEPVVPDMPVEPPPGVTPSVEPVIVPDPVTPVPDPVMPEPPTADPVIPPAEHHEDIASNA